jgi:DNA-binding winged helix-turn-helix (wHTH) protein/TolB-like protein/tetratricopeptide (TPR) repeat protein
MDLRIRTFGAFKFDPGKSELQVNGESVPLQPLQSSLLRLLTERQGQIVLRKDLTDFLWPKDSRGFLSVNDVDENLNTNVKKLRKSLGDHDQSREYIQTVPKQGYRFSEKVNYLTEITPEEGWPHRSEEPALTVEGHSDKPRRPEVLHVMQSRRSYRSAPIVAGLLLVILIGAAFFYTQRRGRPPLIVVLPVVNNTGDRTKDSLSEGLTDELITQLAVMSNGLIRVAPRAASIGYMSKRATFGELSRQLKIDQVDYVLDGSMHDNGFNLTVDMRLDRIEDGANLFVRSWPTDSKSIRSQVASIMASGVVFAIRGLPAFPDAPPRPYFSASKEANDTFDHGTAMRLAEMPDQAVSDFQTVIRIDPDYLDVYTNLAISYYELGRRGLIDQRLAAQEGDKAVDEALFRAPLSAEAHAARGFSRWFYHWDWDGAFKEFRTAVEKDENNPDAHRCYALALASAGKGKEAKAEIELALRSNPESQSLLTDKGWLEYMDHRAADAAHTLEDVLRRNPRYETANIRLWAVYSLQGRNAEALRQLCNISPCVFTSASTRYLISVLEQHGYPDALREWANSQHQAGFLNVLTRAEIASFSSDDETAIRTLRDACYSQDGWLVYAASDPAFDRFRSDSRLREVNNRSCKGSTGK